MNEDHGMTENYYNPGNGSNNYKDKDHGMTYIEIDGREGQNSYMNEELNTQTLIRDIIVT